MSKKTSTTISKSKKVLTPNIKERVSTEVVVKSLEKSAAPLIRKLADFKIKSNDDYSKAMELTKDLKNIAKEANDQLKSIIDPLKQATDAARNIFRPFQTKVTNIEQTVKIAMLEWQQSLMTKKAQLADKFESGEIKKASTFLKKEAELEVTEGVRKVWTAIPVNVKKTPREYLVPDEAKIKEALKAGKKVEGWEWKQVPQIAI